MDIHWLLFDIKYTLGREMEYNLKNGFFSILNIYTCKHKIPSHQWYIYYDMPGN